MSYHCGIGPGIPGLTPCAPYFTCDGCGVNRRVRWNGACSAAPKWFLDGKPPPKWRSGPRSPNAQRRDYCPECEVP